MSVIEPPCVPTPEQITLLRAALGESIPTGGTEADTNFTDAQLDALLVASNCVVETAAARGWLLKAMAATEPRGGMIEYRIGTESVRYMDPADFRQLALDNARLWQGLIPDPLTAASIFSIVPPTILYGGEPWERDQSRLDEELIERPILRRRTIVP